MKFGKCYLSVVMFAFFISNANAQEQADVTSKNRTTTAPSLPWLGLSVQDRAVQSLLVPFYQMNNSGLAADDGNYLAQTKEELQTYYDLGMSYQYIESPHVRALLQLNEGEGIIIESVKPEGLGQRIGFLEGDLVLSVDEVPVQTQYELVATLTEKRGTSTAASVRRNGEITQLSIDLEPVNVKEHKNWIIGVYVEEMSELLRLHLGFDGAVITSLTENGPAEKMGLRINDIILEINGFKVANGEQLREAVQSSEGETLTVAIVRAGNKMTVDLNPVELEPDSTTGISQWAMTLADGSSVLADSSIDLALNPVVDRIALQWALVDRPETAGPDQVKLDDISRQLELLQQQVEALRQSIEK